MADSTCIACSRSTSGRCTDHPMMVGAWPMPTEGRTHDPSEWVMVRKDDLKHFIEKRELKGVVHTCQGQCRRVREALES